MLAERLDIPFIDMDALVEKECGERSPTTFVEHGEDYFRACESRLLFQLTQEMRAGVIATSRDVVTRQDNRARLRTHGVSIYLAVDPETALARLKGDAEPEVRPLLAPADSLAALQSLLKERSQWYEEARYTCSTSARGVERITQELIALLIAGGEIDAVEPIVRHLHAGGGYDAIVDWGGLGRLGTYLKNLGLPPRVFLITDSNVHSLYATHLQGALSDFDPRFYVVPAGEASKSHEQLNAIYDWLIEQRAERREAIIALGGGVIGDLAGYAAATYMRGVPLVQVPTSLLAQVDAAIGGKTGINHPRGKNLIGAFYHPRLVLVDPALLLTLPARERSEGWAEVVKYGIILDATLFAQLEEYADVLRDFSHPPAQLLCQIIARCIALKATVIEEDEREQGQRAILNYGHTVAHALENLAGYGVILHGEAVSIGMAIAAELAQRAGMCQPDVVARQNALLQALGLPVAYTGQVQAGDMLDAIQLDKKVVNKRVRWVMPLRIGGVVITPMPQDVVQPVIREFFSAKRVGLSSHS
jgi:shikimate kinase/3-dehydroquinate synthase